MHVPCVRGTALLNLCRRRGQKMAVKDEGDQAMDVLLIAITWFALDRQRGVLQRHSLLYILVRVRVSGSTSDLYPLQLYQSDDGLSIHVSLDKSSSLVPRT